MRISYYDKGNLQEKEAYGMSIIYDRKGNIILQEGENLIEKMFCGCEISPLHVSKNKPFMFPLAGGGDLHATTRRIVYIRTPHPFYLGPGGMIGWPVSGMLLKKFKETGIKECFDINLSEIIGYEKKKWGVKLFLSYNNDIYSLSLYGKGAIGEAKKCVSPNLFDNLMKKLNIKEKNQEEIKKEYFSTRETTLSHDILTPQEKEVSAKHLKYIEQNLQRMKEEIKIPLLIACIITIVIFPCLMYFFLLRINLSSQPLVTVFFGLIGIIFILCMVFYGVELLTVYVLKCKKKGLRT